MANSKQHANLSPQDKAIRKILADIEKQYKHVISLQDELLTLYRRDVDGLKKDIDHLQSQLDNGFKASLILTKAEIRNLAEFAQASDDNDSKFVIEHKRKGKIIHEEEDQNPMPEGHYVAEYGAEEEGWVELFEVGEN